jgi:hypothetical protein
VLLRRALSVFALCVLALTSNTLIWTVPPVAAAPALSDQTFRLGSIYIIAGHTGTRARLSHHILGAVTLHGRWNGDGRWRIIAKTNAKNPTGFYRIVVRPQHRGVLRLRLRTPDPAVYNVVLTVV